MAAPDRTRRLAAVAAGLVLAIVLGELAWRLGGRALVEAAHAGRLGQLGARLADPDKPLAAALAKAELVRRAALVCAAVALAGLALAGLLARSGWPFAARALVWLAAWLALETWVAPHLAEAFGFADLYVVRDVDHRPTVTGRGGFNADSLRCPWEPGDFDPADLNVVFLGDSFTFGLGLRPEQAFPAQVEALARAAFPTRTVRVANFGWPSASPLLALRRLADVGERYHPDVVLMCVDMTDFYDDIHWASMLERRGLYAFSDRLPLCLHALRRLAPRAFEALARRANPELPEERFFASRAPLAQTRAALGELAGNLARLAAWCAARGARFAVVVLPRSYQYSARECPNNWEAERYDVLGPHAREPFAYFAELAASVDYPIWPLLEDFLSSDVFPTCFDADPHWNEAGSAVAARAIFARLEPLLRELAEPSAAED